MDKLSSLNYTAILIAGAAYWLFGALWFSLIAGKAWSAEVVKHGVKLNTPTGGEMATKFITTFILNVLVAFGIAFLVRLIDMNGAVPGLKLGLITGVTIALSTIGITYLWESRSMKLFFLDVTYPIIGNVICAMILASWR
jgi:hypothetical protein